MHAGGAGSTGFEAALAEFVALRGELDEIARGQRQILILNVSAAGALFGFVLSNAVPTKLLLVAPFVSVALGLLYQQYTMHAKGVGAYIDEHVRPVIVETAGDDRLWRWQRYLTQDMYPGWRSRFAMWMAFLMLVPAVPVFGLAWVLPSLDSFWTWSVWSVGVVMVAAHVTSWFVESRGVEWI
ncbi:hypothetical protein ACQEVZ_44860 [Dactylosporangium sp. CA-152071]|uniref:hypothetical protein n=1 Tax=Dactylosporangium sp. CA-152071 TaxID=3239933 RepID=UPI003D948CF4